MNDGSAQIPYSLIAIVISGIIATVTTVFGILAGRRKDEAEVTVDMSSAWQVTMTELRTEITRLRERVDTLEQEGRNNRGIIRDLEDKLTVTERKLDLAEIKLDQAESNLDIALEWMNDYTPVLKEAGIEPLNIDELKFRGDGDDDDIR